MIKTIDTRNITTAMLKAQDVIDGTTTYSDPLSFKDAADIFIAMAEAAQAVEPAQSCWLRAIDEALVCHHVDVASSDDDYATAKDKLNKLLCVVQDIGAYFAKQEPAQAVPAFWASENVFKESLRDNISCILTTTKCAANTVPLYTAPPAINEEIVYQVWRSTDFCEECWSWDDCDKEDYDKAHPTDRRRVVILDEC